MARDHGRRKSGLRPFAYVGVEPISPFQFFVYEKSPTVDDYTIFNVGDLWFDESADEVWMLIQKIDTVATWYSLGLIPFSATSFPTDSGTATQVGGVINLFGSGVISTTGSGNTATVGIPGGTDGQLLIGGGAASVWANITSSGGTVDITEGSNSINLEITGVGGVASLVADAGTATPDGANTITITGDSNINTSAAAAVLTINLNNSVSIPGPLTLSPLGAGVMQTSGAGVVTSDNGTNGQVLIGGGAAPAWANITSTGGSVTITNAANSIDLSYSGGGGGSVSSFLAYQNGNANNVTGDGLRPITEGSATTYTLGTTTAFATVFDTGGDISIGGGGSPVTFTAPVTGKYSLILQVYNTRSWDVSLPDSLVYFAEMEIITTARTYAYDEKYYVPEDSFTTVNEKTSRSMVAVADMTAGDTATYTVRLDAPAVPYPGGKSESIINASSADLQTYISGFLLS